MGIKFKEGVDTSGVKPRTIQAMFTVTGLMSYVFDRDLVVTSVNDGTHMTGSKHYTGDAFDIRTWKTDTCGEQMGLDQKKLIRRLIVNRLGKDWDVVIESTHIHIEYDPKD